VLNRVEADRVLRAIADILADSRDQRLIGVGTDFSGRYWFRGKLAHQSIRAIAKDFFSVQAIHAPLYSLTTAGRPTRGRPAARVANSPRPAVDHSSLPCVAVVDLGVPSDHIQLAQFRRGQITPQGAATNANDHGSFVASRVVFGDCESGEALQAAAGRCSFYDVVVGEGYGNRVNDKIVMDALRAVRAAAPDVRVFNLSFGDFRPLSDFDEVERRERRLELQDLDNFAAANDVVVVVAAGNSAPGVAPTPPYPNNHNDQRWALGPWACGFNSLVCGSYVSNLSAHGLVKTVGFPSPFTRAGPGLCEAPVPSFCAPGGNSDEAYNAAVGLGVWGYSDAGLAEDRMGTSQASPVLAREAALALDALRQHCAAGTQPFAVTARAFLALTATSPNSDPSVRALSERTLGLGVASSNRLTYPFNGSAVVLWQGHIESPNDVVRIQLPIPLAFLHEADEPLLHIVVAYDPPVNAAATELWACRSVNVTLHPDPESRALMAPGRKHRTYPLFHRTYELSKGRAAAKADTWTLELKYDEIFDYPPGMDFDPRQRVAIAAELFDGSPEPVDAQEAIQSLPIAATMNRFSVVAAAARTPVIIRNR
jgi:hypothetical protein